MSRELEAFPRSGNLADAVWRLAGRGARRPGGHCWQQAAALDACGERRITAARGGGLTRRLAHVGVRVRDVRLERGDVVRVAGLAEAEDGAAQAWRGVAGARGPRRPCGPSAGLRPERARGR